MTHLSRTDILPYIFSANFSFFAERHGDTILRQYLKDDSMPYLGDLIRGTNLMFLNTHYSLSGPKPNTPALIELGGIHIKTPKPLDKVSARRLQTQHNLMQNFILPGNSRLFGQSRPRCDLRQLGLYD